MTLYFSWIFILFCGIRDGWSTGLIGSGPVSVPTTCCWITDTISEVTDVSQLWQRVRSNCIFRTKSYAVDELARFLITGVIDVSSKLIKLYCWICRKNVLVLTHIFWEVLSHFHGIRRESSPETPGWRLVDFEGNPCLWTSWGHTDKTILRAPLVLLDREYLFHEDLNPDASMKINPQL